MITDNARSNSLESFLGQLESSPESIAFAHTMAVIDANYLFQPSAFRNGDVHNQAGQNLGSCKIFAFGKLHGLSTGATLACFGENYRTDVLEQPNEDNHQNIRNFMKHGWDSVEFLTDLPVLVAR